MEFVPGDDLATLLARNGGPFTTVQALRWADQLLDVLDYLHTRQPPSLHRDIKPQNLKLTPRGKIMLLDFGLAKAGWSAAQEKQAGGVRVSSLQFLPPEQVAGAGADARSDLFALAATLYYLLTGELPALAGRRANAAARGLPDPLRPIHEVNPQVPAPVSAVLMQALALDPAQRPASAAEMRVAIERASASPLVLAATLAPTQPLAPPAPEAATVPLQPTDQLPIASLPSAPPPPTIEVTRSAHMPATPAPVPAPARSRWRIPAIAGGAIVLLLAGLVLVGLVLLGLIGGTRSTAQQPTPAIAVEPAAATDLLARPTAAAPTAPAATAISETTSGAIRPRPTNPPPAQQPTAAIAQVAAVEPQSAFAGMLPIVLTVRGTDLDQVRQARLVPESGPPIDATIQRGDAGQLTLSVAALPAPISGEASYRIELDGMVAESPAITLRDFVARKPAQGILAQYEFTNRVASDQAGAYTGMREEPNAQSAAVGRLRNGDEVDVLRDNVDGWYQVRVHASADAAQIGATGWIERWLVDNQGAPVAQPTAAPLVFAGRVYSTPTDGAVRCGRSFESSIFGSVEDGGGRGIGGARLRIVSADGRNSYAVTTGRGGVYSAPGLGCTTWIVRLISVPNVPNGIQANRVTVKNLNGGRYTSAEVRFKLQK